MGSISTLSNPSQTKETEYPSSLLLQTKTSTFLSTHTIRIDQFKVMIIGEGAGLTLNNIEAVT
jgi:hypothetical protein